MRSQPPWLPEAQRPPTQVPVLPRPPAALLRDDQGQAIATSHAWQWRRDDLLRRWRAFLGVIPNAGPIGKVETLATDTRDGVERRLVRYEAEPGLPVEAYLLRPPGDSTVRRPGVAVFHSTTDATIDQPAGLAGPADKHIGLDLARRGYVVVCPRCFLWQHSKGGRIATAVDWLRDRHPKVTGMAKMLFDASRAVDLLVELPGVDPRRLGAIGHSLGAKEVLYLAAFDPRIRATVSSEGGIGIDFSNWEAAWYLGPAVKDAAFPLDHAQILALIAPRAFLLLGGDSADGDRSWPYIAAGMPVWSLLGAPEAVGLLNHRQGHAYPVSAQESSRAFLHHLLAADA